MYSIAKRRRRWYVLLRQMDSGVRLTSQLQGDMLLDRVGLSRDQKLMIKTSISNDSDYEKVAEALQLQHGKIHVHEKSWRQQDQKRPWKTWKPAAHTATVEEETPVADDAHEDDGYDENEDPEDDEEEFFDEVEFESEAVALTCLNAFLVETEDISKDEETLCAELCQNELVALFGWRRKGKGKGKGKSKRKGSGKGKRHTGFLAKGFGKGKNLSLDARRQRLAELKAKSNCQACGARGHWAGDSVCPKQKDGNKKFGGLVFKDRSASSTLPPSSSETEDSGSKEWENTCEPSEDEKNPAAYPAVHQMSRGADTDDDDDYSMMDSNALLKMIKDEASDSDSGTERKTKIKQEPSDSDADSSAEVDKKTMFGKKLKNKKVDFDKIKEEEPGKKAMERKALTKPIFLITPHQDPTLRCKGKDPCMTMVSRKGSNQFVDIRTCKGCGFQEKTKAKPIHTHDPSTCPHMHTDYRGSTTTHKNIYCKQCGKEWHVKREIHERFQRKSKEAERQKSLRDVILKLNRSQLTPSEALESGQLFKEMLKKLVEDTPSGEKIDGPMMVQMLEDSMSMVIGKSQPIKKEEKEEKSSGSGYPRTAFVASNKNPDDLQELSDFSDSDSSAEKLEKFKLAKAKAKTTSRMPTGRKVQELPEIDPFDESDPCLYGVLDGGCNTICHSTRYAKCADAKLRLIGMETYWVSNVRSSYAGLGTHETKNSDAKGFHPLLRT